MKKYYFYSVIFFGIVGCFKLIHLDLLYGNRLIDPERYAKEINETSKTIEDCVEGIWKEAKDDD